MELWAGLVQKTASHGDYTAPTDNTGARRIYASALASGFAWSQMPAGQRP